MDKNFWMRLGDEEGPEQCKAPGCGRLHISLSTLCRRHHYENGDGPRLPVRLGRGVRRSIVAALTARESLCLSTRASNT